jgi:glycosyltransferase involved in cell wall biosynthesis
MRNKLSIITVNLNNASGLIKTIESVYIQLFTDFEYIIIDGASNDGSILAINNFFEENQNSLFKERFTLISEPDSGVFEAMNKGIKIAKGDYLLFLNSGDFLVDSNVLTDVFLLNPIEDILCGRCLVSKNGKVIYVTNPPEDFSLNFFYYTTIAHQSSFIRKSLFETYGLYREDLILMSDWEFWIRTIILGDASTKRINVIVSDYNVEGISSDPKNEIITSNETKAIYSDLNLQSIIVDYQNWSMEKKEMEAMYWIKSKKIIYTPLKFLYKIASLLYKNRNNE